MSRSPRILLSALVFWQNLLPGMGLAARVCRVLARVCAGTQGGSEVPGARAVCARGQGHVRLEPPGPPWQVWTPQASPWVREGGRATHVSGKAPVARPCFCFALSVPLTLASGVP